MPYTFRISKASDGRWYLTIEHANGQCLLTSETYERAADAETMLENFISHIMHRALDVSPEELVRRHTLRQAT